MLLLNFRRFYHLNKSVKFSYALLIFCLNFVGPACADADEVSSEESSEEKNNSVLSTPEECARKCGENEPAKTCYYHFTAELYTVRGSACDLCTPDNNTLSSTCQCVNADGVERGILTINRMLPGPSIQVCLSDKVVIDVENKIQGMELSIHWHGILQIGSPYYDGVPFITQCPIHQGNTFRYQWVANNSGSHYWHVHTGLQKMDGLFGSVIVRSTPSDDPNYYLYDYDLPEHVFIVNDWMHQDYAQSFPGRLITDDHLPASLLINGKGRYTDTDTGNVTDTPLEIFTIHSGEKYRFRMINALCTNCPVELTIQGHTMTVIATDGEPFEPIVVNTIIASAGERYDFIINANQTPGAYWIQVRGINQCTDLELQQLAILSYNGMGNDTSTEEPTYAGGLDTGIILNPLDGDCDEFRTDAVCVNQLRNSKAVDEKLLKSKPDVKLFLAVNFYGYTTEELFEPNTYEPFFAVAARSFASIINDISFEYPASPLLSQRKDIPKENFCNTNNVPDNCGTPCSCLHEIDIELDDVVEIILFDESSPQVDLFHPFHLHGNAFYVLAMGQPQIDNETSLTLDYIQDLDEQGLLDRNFDRPPAKDTIKLPSHGYVILRFLAENLGSWLFHCHIIHHQAVGMEMVFHVGNDSDLPPVPKGFPVCGNYLPPIKFGENN